MAPVFECVPDTGRISLGFSNNQVVAAKASSISIQCYIAEIRTLRRLTRQLSRGSYRSFYRARTSRLAGQIWKVVAFDCPISVYE